MVSASNVYNSDFLVKIHSQGIRPERIVFLFHGNFICSIPDECQFTSGVNGPQHTVQGTSVQEICDWPKTLRCCHRQHLETERCWCRPSLWGFDLREAFVADNAVNKTEHNWQSSETRRSVLQRGLRSDQVDVQATWAEEPPTTLQIHYKVRGVRRRSAVSLPPV